MAIVPRELGGRWTSRTKEVIERVSSEVQARTVETSEVTNVTGTYIGNFLFVPQHTTMTAMRGDYSVVINSDVKESRAFYAATEVKFCTDELQELAIKTYAPRLCLGEPVADFMLQ